MTLPMGAIYDGPLAVMIEDIVPLHQKYLLEQFKITQKGLVIGQKNFGKGSVQNPYPPRQIL
ncbi:MAG: hypothetical protein Ct9H300mP6_17720 [Gammaproteobacteria bacterium]|nr:MAG: hypothetical protein Ct9H300mP6_17720 [Gammaproteobacteria bacterium]